MRRLALGMVLLASVYSLGSARALTGCGRRDATVVTADPQNKPLPAASGPSTPPAAPAPSPSPSLAALPEPPSPPPTPPKLVKQMPLHAPTMEAHEPLEEWKEPPPGPVPGGVMGGAVGGVVGGVAAGPPSPTKAATPPTSVSMPPPEYPPDAKAQGKEGRVVVRLDIDEQGNVVGTKVLSGSSPFTEAVLAKTPSWKFRPARDADGKPVRSQTTATVPFRIN